MYRSLGAPPDPTDAQLTAMLQEALGPPSGATGTIRETLPAVRPATSAVGVGVSLGAPGWLLILGAAGLGLWALSKGKK